ncbi:MAG: chloride channel protein [Acidimicrobiales bacterium]
MTRGIFGRLLVPLDTEISLGHNRVRMVVLAAFGILLGLVGGVAAYVVVRLVGLLSNLALLHRVGTGLPNLSHYHPGPVLVPVALAGALVVVLLARWSPVIKGHGIPESLEAIVLRESRVAPRTAVAKPLSAAVAMGTGGPFGAEGPIIVTGGSVGSLLGQLVRVSPAERRILLATGAAAGMAGVFATPVAAIVLAFELLLFERSLRSLLPLLLATGTATELHGVLLGAHPLFAVEHPVAVSAVQLPMVAVLGLAAGLLAVVLDKGLFAVEAGFRRLPISELFHPLLGALGFAVIGLAVPGSLSVGYWAITDAVNGRFLLGTAAVLFAGKLASWWVALASNTSGGTLAPTFLVGSTMGEMLGIGFAHLFPSAHLHPAAFAVLAMGATFGVAARAPLTGAVFALEVTGDFRLTVPMLLVVGVAEVVGEQFLAERLMTDKLVRRGFRVEFDTETDPFRTSVAGQAMDPLEPGDLERSLPRIDRHAYLSDALVAFLDSDTDEVVVADGGVPVGVLRRHTMRAALAKRLAESVRQPPTLGRRRRVRVRVRRVDEEHPGTSTGEDEPFTHR